MGSDSRQRPTKSHVRRSGRRPGLRRGRSRRPRPRPRTTCVRTGDLSLLVARGTLLSTVDRIKEHDDGHERLRHVERRRQPGRRRRAHRAHAARTPPSRPTAPRKSSAPDAQGDPYAIARRPRARSSTSTTAIKRFSKLGEVQSVTTSSEDVTSQYVDLQARLRHYRAVERRLVGFLSADDHREPDAGRPGPHRQGPADHRGAHRAAQVAARDHHLRDAVGVRLREGPRRRRRSTPATPSAARSGTRSTCSAAAPG